MSDIDWPRARHTQVLLHEEGGPPGDCLRAAVASILGMDPTDVPHFAAIDLGVPAPDLRCSSWKFALVGWMVCLEPSFDTVPFDPPDWIEPTDDDPLGGCYLLSGPSPRGTWTHSVVARAGVVIWDPHPSRAGLAGTPTAAERFVLHEARCERRAT